MSDITASTDQTTATTRPLDELGRLIEILSRQAEASSRTADLIESKALPLLERIALALERAPSPGLAVAEVTGLSRPLVEFRQAIEAADWAGAEAIVRDLGFDDPEATRVLAMTEELNRSRGFAIDDLRQRIEAARQANDAEGLINSRDELAKILHGEAMQLEDRPLVKWLMGLIQRRLRSGTIRPDLVTLAGRIAESFGATTEGASLRASLPTLRRSAGLCPKCAEVYAGVGDACPKCLAASTAPAPPPPPDSLLEAIEVPEDPEIDENEGPIDLNNARFWQGP